MHWVSKGQKWLVLGDIESVLCGTDLHLVVLGQYRAVLVNFIALGQLGSLRLYTLKHMDNRSNITDPSLTHRL